jgi:hypothetical protein
MPGNSSWMPYAPQGVKGFDDDDDDDEESFKNIFFKNQALYCVKVGMDSLT